MNIVLVVAWLGALAGPAGDRRAAAQAADDAVGVADACESYYRSLLRAYRTDRARHLRVTAGYLRMVRALQLEVLPGCEARLARHVTTDGAGPYLGVISEHAHRLARFSDPMHERRLVQLGAAVVPALRRESASAAAATGRMTLIRAYRDGGYIAVSENAARSVVGFQLSPAGQSMAGAGTTAEALLKSIETYRECAEVTTRPTDAAGRRAHLQCQTLIEELRRWNREGATDAFGMVEVARLLETGAWKAQEACLASSGYGDKVIDEMEERLACERAQADAGPGPGVTPSGLMQTQDVQPPHVAGSEDIKKKLEGFTLADTKVDPISGENVVGLQYTFHYTSDSDPNHTITIMQYSIQKGETWADSESYTGTVVMESTENGITTEAYDSGGELVTEEMAGTG
jgi:hypothetical protein